MEATCQRCAHTHTHAGDCGHTHDQQGTGFLILSFLCFSLAELYCVICNSLSG